MLTRTRFAELRHSLWWAAGLLLLAGCGSDWKPETEIEPRATLGDGLAPAEELEPEEFFALEIPADAPLVVFLGDSLSAGLHLPAEQAFPAVVQRELYERELPFRLINAGISGDTTAGGLARTDWILKQSPDVLVVELGANDGLRGIPVESMRVNLNSIVANARGANCRVLLLGVLIPPSYGAEYSQAVAELYPSLAKELELPFVPFFMEGVAGVKELTLPDGLHPTAKGHRRLAANITDALADLLTPK